MRIRKFKKGDASECSELILRVLESEVRKRHMPKRVRETIRRNASPSELIKKSKSRDYFVCEEKGRVIGIGGLRKREVIRMYTLPISQGKGVGSAILKRIENQAKKNKIKKLFLYTHPEALRFYVKNKFNVIKKFKDRGVWVIYMEKWI